MSTGSTMMAKLEGSIDRAAVGSIGVSAKGGIAIESMAQTMEFAKLMSISRQAVPQHLRENPGACLAIAIQAFDWRINPYALAQKSYIVKDTIAYEASIYHSVVARRAPIVGRVKMEYSGKGGTRTCKVWAELEDGTGTVDYTSPELDTIKPQNSPLWKTDPDQQLFYYSVRAFTRRHFPDVMMGVYTVDEIMDSVDVVKAIPASITLDSLTSPQVVNDRADAANIEDDDTKISDDGEGNQ